MAFLKLGGGYEGSDLSGRDSLSGFVKKSLLLQKNVRLGGGRGFRQPRYRGSHFERRKIQRNNSDDPCVCILLRETKELY